jgi:hypothetical protein
MRRRRDRESELLVSVEENVEASGVSGTRKSLREIGHEWWRRRERRRK